jgi:catecholate siderophore receptor
MLLATTCFATGGLGVIEAAGQGEKTVAHGDKADDANAQAIALETIEVQSTNTASVGYLGKRTSTATKTDTPLLDIPQSITVVTKQQIQDTGAQKLEDVVRYVPGVNWHQGEGNRDQIVIRGQSSTADFFVNGMRDDAQIYRDLYNVQRIEVLKGPNAMIFGRGGSGGVLNRVLKEADGRRIRELTLQGGSFDHKRVSFDVGDKVSDTFAARLNGVYEQSGSYRDFVELERYGINPTMTWTPTAFTRFKLSYEYFHDRRTADRGIPSQNGLPYDKVSYAPFFGNPYLSFTPSTSNIVMASAEHEFSDSFKVKNQIRFQDTQKFYQNVCPGTAVSAAETYSASAYNNTNNRRNIVNQTDWTLKAATDFVRHTFIFGTEFANQRSDNARFTGFFNNGTVLSNPLPALFPTTFQPVAFAGLASDARNRTDLNIAAAYVQDQIELTRWLQVIAGTRFERFDLTYVNLNTQSPTYGQQFSRVDDLVSPRAGVVVKPVDPLSLYVSYSVSYLPASGDQFNALTAVSTRLKPEEFTNKEVGVKWDITPVLGFTAAVFRLDRENTPVRDNTNVAVATGASRAEGVEVGLAGYVTDKWQMTAGYTNLRAFFLTDTSNAAGRLAARAGAHVPFTPQQTYSLWNRYDFTEKWGAGVGLISQTHYFANADNLVIVPGFTRVDGAVFYRFNDNLRAQLNVENIFGTKYYPTADANNNITPGSPRAARFTMILNQ